LAAAIALEPGVPGALKRLVIMGGSLGRGNVTPYAEFNIYVDPEAAAQVFAACPLTMVGLDVTERTILARAAWEGLRETDTSTGRLVYGACEHSFLVRQDEGVQLHDPLAVGVALDPSLCTVKRGTVSVETATAWCAGRTTLQERSDGPHAVCTDVDADRFRRFFFDTLGLGRIED
jgi:inosine-uridine nucleoside N-ribohydrolase